MIKMASDKKETTTDFGYKEVPTEQKSHLVADIFKRVAPKYDLMNDLMSFGLHRLWKQFLIHEASIRPTDYVLDVASGTGDLAFSFVKNIGQEGKLVLSDINESMLSKGRDRLRDKGFISSIDYVLADAEQLPFKHCFNLISIAFGLRNVTNKEAALHSFFHALKPGGKVLILEFSQPTSQSLNKLYDFYSFNIIPKLGEWVAKDKDSYQYLVESIRMHPDQDTLKNMMEKVGFEDVTYFNLSGGIVALHKGYKY